jgi:hypothetical protein
MVHKEETLKYPQGEGQNRKRELFFWGGGGRGQWWAHNFSKISNIPFVTSEPKFADYSGI